MWRAFALMLLVFAGCESSQALKQPMKLPNPDFLVEDSGSFFAGPEQPAKPQPATPH
jgi:hypothetical protein